MDVLKVHPDDNVLVALSDLAPGAEVVCEGQTYVLPTGARAKHKVVTRDLAAGDAVVMYGVMVGKTAEPIARGMPVTTENVVDAAQDYGASIRTRTWRPPDVSGWQGRHFLGYHRSDGQVGTANHWLVIPMVFCENRNVNVLAEAFRKELGYAQPDVYRQQVAALVSRHQEGAGADALREPGSPPDKPALVARPLFTNVDGIQFLTTRGLRRHAPGCPHPLRAPGRLHPQPERRRRHRPQPRLREVPGRDAARGAPPPQSGFDKPLLVFEQQRSVSEYAMLTTAIHETFAAVVEANAQTRAPASLDRLTLGVECGGSDGFSGLSANPAIGHVADLLVALGGTVILAEFPELTGVEQDLVDRCASPEVADRFMRLMREYASRAEAVDAGFETNPSPGNIRDGLITIAMKSAGAARKGGTSPVTGALGYPEYATEAGLTLLCTPGGDVESTTGLAGAGAKVILFSTGLGTPTGNPVAPVIKVSTNTSLARRLPDLIDFDAGPIIAGRRPSPRPARSCCPWFARWPAARLSPGGAPRPDRLHPLEAGDLSLEPRRAVSGALLRAITVVSSAWAALSRKRSHSCAEGRHDLARRPVAGPERRHGPAGPGRTPRRRVLRLPDPVGVEHEEIVLRQPQRVALVLGVRDEADRGAAAHEPADLAGGVHEQARQVAGVDVGEGAAVHVGGWRRRGWRSCWTPSTGTGRR